MIVFLILKNERNAVVNRVSKSERVRYGVFCLGWGVGGGGGGGFPALCSNPLVFQLCVWALWF